MQHDLEREKLAQTIQEDRTELRRALRDLGFSLLLGLNLPRRIRRRPLPWALGALGLAAVVIVGRRRRKRAEQRSHWWGRGGAQA